MTAETKFEPSNVNVRIKISALLTSMLFVFAYVDVFSLYRPDFRADLEAGEIGTSRHPTDRSVTHHDGRSERLGA
jgi:hypothetical protein